MCGVSPTTLLWIWEFLEPVCISFTAPRNLLMTLHFLRCYPVAVVGSTIWRLQDEDYYLRLIWNTLVQMHTHLPVLPFEARLEQQVPTGMFDGMLCIVDATEVLVEPGRKSWHEQAIYYSGKKKIHALKYQIMIRSSDGIIVDTYGPFFAGCTHDKTMMDQWIVLNEHKLGPLEIIGGDKGYIGQDRCLTPYKKTKTFNTEERLFNDVFGSVRCLVEQSIGRIKVFKAMYEKWRHDHSRHEMVFKICVILANHSIRERPLRNNENKLLYL